MPPNPRLQRTPLRAPLSRKPLGRTEVLFLSIVTLWAPWVEAANKAVPFATARELAGAWVGYGSDDVAYRLDLNLDGSGLLAFTYPFLKPEFYRVTKWSVVGRRFAAGAVSEADPEDSFLIEGEAWLNKLDLQIKRKVENRLE